MDAPGQALVRQVVSDMFARDRLHDIELHARAVLRRILSELPSEGTIDLAADVASPLSLGMTAKLLGIPATETDLFRALADGYLDGQPEATAALHVYLQTLVQERSRRPVDDVISRIASAATPPVGLSREEMLRYCALFIEAGYASTRHALAAAIMVLLDHPDQRTELLSMPGLVPQAVEEILRYTSPIICFSRRVMVETRLGGVTLASGERVTVYFPSGNRDEKIFERADDFDIRRRDNRHIAFGTGGPHHCLGAPLARIALRVLLEEFCPRLVSGRRVGDVQYDPSTFALSIRRALVQCCFNESRTRA
jgi:cytochrome P450